MTERKATSMTDAEIAAELDDLGEQFDEYRANCEGHSGSPGEWMVERMDELETERVRRIISLDGDIGRRAPRLR